MDALPIETPFKDKLFCVFKKQLTKKTSDFLASFFLIFVAR